MIEQGARTTEGVSAFVDHLDARTSAPRSDRSNPDRPAMAHEDGVNEPAGSRGVRGGSSNAPSRPRPRASGDAASDIEARGKEDGKKGSPDVLMLHIGKAELLKVSLAAPELVTMTVPASRGIPPRHILAVETALKDKCILLHQVRLQNHQ